jgi:RND family efflux transporter MFP subunit
MLFSALPLPARDTTSRAWRGVLEAREQAVIPSEVSMPVARLAKRPGESCDEGEALVEFDRSIALAALKAAEAKYKANEFNLAAIRNLHQRNQSTAVELSRAETEFAQAELDLAGARRNLGICRIAAPFSGRIADVKVREHEWADRGAPLLTLVDDRVVRARFFLPETHFSNIKLGDRVMVFVPAAGRGAPGEVSRLGVVFDPVSKTFDVWADVANPDDAFRVGMTAEIAWPAPEATP